MAGFCEQLPLPPNYAQSSPPQLLVGQLTRLPFHSGYATDYAYYEPFKPFLCYAMCFTLHSIFMHFDKHSPDSSRDTYLAQKGFRRPTSGPWTKKDVHH